MPQLTVSVEHNLGKEEATKRIRDAVHDAKCRLSDTITDVRECWEDGTAWFSFRVKGISVQGTLNVEPLRIKLQSKFPRGALLFKKKAEKDIERKARRLLT